MRERLEIGRLAFLRFRLEFYLRTVENRQKRTAIRFRWFMWRERQRG